MIVVADTSPINYLVLIGEIEVLPALFGQVLIPLAAFQELQHPKTPIDVRHWITHPSRLAGGAHCFLQPLTPRLTKLDLGEREAIQLALELGVTTLLIDEAEGRRVAEMLHLEVRGTLGILERASKLGKIDFRQALRKLEQTPFRVSPVVRAEFLKRNP